MPVPVGCPCYFTAFAAKLLLGCPIAFAALVGGPWGSGRPSRPWSPSRAPVSVTASVGTRPIPRCWLRAGCHLRLPSMLHSSASAPVFFDVVMWAASCREVFTWVYSTVAVCVLCVCCVVCCVWCFVSCVLCLVCCVLCCGSCGVVCCVLCVLCFALCVVCCVLCVVLAEVSASAGEYEASLGGGLRRHARCAEWCVLALEVEEALHCRVRLVIKSMDGKRALAV